MTIKETKLEFFYLRRAFLKKGSGFKYARNKFFLSPSILKQVGSFDSKPVRDDLSIHMLIGHKHLVMAIWSLGSYYASSSMIGHLYIHSDGSLRKNDIKILRRFFPNLSVVHPDDGLNPSKTKWGRSRLITDFRSKHSSNYFLTKLLDPLLISHRPYHLILDCDVLWFRDPVELKGEIDLGCEKSLMMKGAWTNEKELSNTVYFKDGSHLDNKFSNFNGGIIFHSAENLPVDKLEEYLGNIDMTHPLSRHFVEQSGYSYCLRNLKALPDEKYTIKGEIDNRVVAKHYTGPRREFFYIGGLPSVKDRLFSALND